MLFVHTVRYIIIWSCWVGFLLCCFDYFCDLGNLSEKGESLRLLNDLVKKLRGVCLSTNIDGMGIATVVDD